MIILRFSRECPIPRYHFRSQIFPRREQTQTFRHMLIVTNSRFSPGKKMSSSFSCEQSDPPMTWMFWSGLICHFISFLSGILQMHFNIINRNEKRRKWKTNKLCSYIIIYYRSHIFNIFPFSKMLTIHSCENILAVLQYWHPPMTCFLGFYGVLRNK